MNRSQKDHKGEDPPTWTFHWKGVKWFRLFTGVLLHQSPKGCSRKAHRLGGAGILLMYFFGGWHNLKTSLAMDLCTTYGRGAMCHVNE